MRVCASLCEFVRVCASLCEFSSWDLYAVQTYASFQADIYMKCEFMRVFKLGFLFSTNLCEFSSCDFYELLACASLRVYSDK